MKTIVYVVHAYRWGSRENHSYLVGVFDKKDAALKSAEAETEYRGGKYECEVLECTVGESRRDANPKVILALHD